MKFFFKNYSEDKKVSRYLPSSKNENKIFEILNKKVIIPSAEEIKKNPPSRSAKLRYVRKTKEGANFEEFLLKFKNLIENENIGMQKQTTSDQPGVDLWEGSSSVVRQGRHWSSALIWTGVVLLGATVIY